MASFFASLASLPTRLQRVTSSGSYVPQIDGLRFIAILVVIIYHSSSRALKYYQPTGSIESFFVKYQPNGMAGVELFFFISGLIISYPFLSGNKPSLAKFYKRRLLRLEPPYILVLTICFLGLGVLGFQPDAATQFELQEMPLWQSYVSSIFYMHGTLYGTAPRLNPPLWSLEIEVVFYLLAPFLLAGYLKIQSFRNRVIFAIGAVLAGLLVQAIVVSINYPWYYRFPTHLYAFFLGIVVSDWTTRKDSFYSDRSRIFDLLWMFGFIALFVSASLQNIATDAVTYSWVLMLRACAIFCLFIGTAWGPLARRVMGTPWLALIGGACYSIYLVHVPVMNVVASIVFRFVQADSLATAWAISLSTLMLASILSGLIFYVLVERPCMRQDWPRRLWQRLTGKPVVS